MIFPGMDAGDDNPAGAETVTESDTHIKESTLYRLPLEIRILIWKLCRPDPRTVRFYPLHFKMRAPSHLLLNRATSQEAKPFSKQIIKLLLHDYVQSIDYLHRLNDRQWGFVSAIEIKEYDPNHGKLVAKGYKGWLARYLKTSLSGPGRRFSKVKEQFIRNDIIGAPGTQPSGATTIVSWTVQVLHSE